jgi:S-adenosylmethionine-diacylglycerol 3-amino-3-carboxypropyl transferase
MRLPHESCAAPPKCGYKHNPMANKLLKEAAVNHRLTSKRGVMERMFTMMFQGFVYNQIWEDPDVDMAALRLRPDSRIITIASGGCNVVNYLAGNPARVIAVDLNPNHIALTRLKLAALKYLPTYEDFFQFFGHANTRKNRENFDNYLAHRLDDTTRRHWQKSAPLRGQRINMFSKDLYRYSLLGRFLGVLQTVARLHGKQLNEMLAAKTVAEQRAIFNRVIAPLFDSKLVKALSRMPVSFYALGIPPAQYDELAKASNGDPAGLIRQRIEKLACDFPLQSNYFAWQAFGRRYDTQDRQGVPAYLQEKTYNIVRERVDRVETHLASMTDFLAKQPLASVDCYVLLDAQDWMNEEQITALWEQITRTAAPKARVIFRTAGPDSPLERKLPAELIGRWNYMAEEAQRFHDQDRSSIYGGFHIYELKGN